MNRLKAFFAAVKVRAVALFFKLIAWLKILLGSFSYQPPHWVKKFRETENEKVIKAKAKLAAVWNWIRGHKKIVGSVIGVAILSYAGWEGWKYYKYNLPHPEWTSQSVTTPAHRNFFDESSKPNPLRIVFSRSVADLKLIRTEIKDGVRISPMIAGKWMFVTDSILEFQPVNDWEPGKEYSYSFERKIFANSVELYDYSGSFKTEKFRMNSGSSEFNQHPTIPKEKKGVATIHFNYPVNPSTFSNRIKASLSNELGFSSSIKFTVQYNKYFTEAYLHSEFIPIPARDSTLEFVVDSGVQSSYGGNPFEHEVRIEINVPGMYNYFKISDVRSSVIRNQKFEPEHVLIVTTSTGARTEDVAKSLKAWVLPKDNPYVDSKEKIERWDSTGEVDKEVRKQMQSLPLEMIPSEFENSTMHSFRYKPEVGRWMYVEIKKGLKSFGDYILSDTFESIHEIPYLDKELMIMHHGAILSLQGEKKIPILTRNIGKIEYFIHRMRPDELHHLISQTSGDFRNPYFQNYRFNQDNISDRFEDKIEVDNTDPTKTQYHSFDFSKYLNNGGKGPRGVFFFRAVGDKGEESKKFIVVTDMGLITKSNIHNETQVFVQSFSTGRPVTGAEVEVLSINGSSILSATTDSDGQVTFPDFRNYTREKKPIAIIAKNGSDTTYMPIGESDRNISLHRFDIGGIEASGDTDKLQVFAFTDRGIYRPGDTTKIGVIAKNLSWKPLPSGLPLEFSITNARGTEVMKEAFTVTGHGFLDFSHTTTEEAPTGTYNASVYLIQKGKRSTMLGSVSYKVEEFLPDRMKILTTLSKESPQGWVKTSNIKAKVLLTNLFGTPAQDRKIESEFRLYPAFPNTSAFADYRFMDPKQAKESYSERLDTTNTDENGEAEFELDLNKFAAGSYRLEYQAEGFEAEGGRSVTASVSVFISPADYVVGFKADGDLSYIKVGTPRKVEFIAVNNEMKKTTAKKLKAKVIERKYVSVLTEQSNGTYQYQTVEKEVPVGKPKDVTISQSGFIMDLDTSKDGSYIVLITDSEDTVYAKVYYSVMAPSGLARGMDRNAELQITLNKPDYRKGDEIELNIRAPYTGAGLITIERGRVHASTWFKTDSETSVQKIRVPSDLEGNAYVSVIFLRSLDSREIYTSPMSYGVAPFTISKDARKNIISLKAPQVVRPGDKVKIQYSTTKPTSIVLYGVDEGILQVANYQLPDPLNYFFTKRALQVTTAQILDLLLPELSVFESLSAAGGDESSDEGRAALSQNLNPFKRKRDKPVVFWSGIIQASEKENTYIYEVPDYFNGSMKLMAIAASDEAVGNKATNMTVRGDFVLSPNVPLFVTPGDEFEVSVGVSNTSTGSKEAKGIKLKLETSEHLEILGAREKSLDIKEGSEKSEVFRLKAKAKLGSASVKFNIDWNGKKAKSATDLSLRPALPYMTDLKMGLAQATTTKIDVKRPMYAEFRDLSFSASLLPLTMADGLMKYLEQYPYGCTEQIVSKGFPTIVLSSHPDFKVTDEFLKNSYNTVVKTLRARQTSNGGFGLWNTSTESFDFPSLYAIHYLTESKERGLTNGEDLLERGLEYLQSRHFEDADSIHSARLWAYSLYLQARNAIVPKRSLELLRSNLDSRYKEEWKTDLTGVYLSGTYALLQQKEEGLKVLQSYKRGGKGTFSWNFYYDISIRESQYLYIAAQYYPDELKNLKSEDFISMLSPLMNGGYTTTNSSYAVLGLNAYVRSMNESGKSILNDIVISEWWKGGENKLQLGSGLFPKTDFDAKADELRITNPKKFQVFYQATQAGFDLNLPVKTIQEGIEIERQFLDESDTEVKEVKNGSEIWVRIRARTIKDTGLVNNVAVVDLLPGGFEVVADSIRNPVTSTESSSSQQTYSNAHSYSDSENEGEGDGEYDSEREHEEEQQEEQTYTSGSNNSMYAKYVDIREDRVVIFTDLDSEVKEFKYKIKATNAGKYVVPPAFAESMYDRAIKARGLAAGISIVK